MRKKKAKPRAILPDEQYKDILVTKFVNNLMIQGKKSIAFKLFYKSLALVSEKTTEEGYDVWKKALENIYPKVEVKRKRVGGSTLQIPIEVREERKLTLGIKWLIEQARARKENGMIEKLAKEIIEASQGTGGAVKKKENLHKMAESNKAFSHIKF